MIACTHCFDVFESASLSRDGSPRCLDRVVCEASRVEHDAWCVENEAAEAADKARREAEADARDAMKLDARSRRLRELDRIEAARAGLAGCVEAQDRRLA